jgi:DNA-binding response OmpR family regulator
MARPPHALAGLFTRSLHIMILVRSLAVRFSPPMAIATNHDGLRVVVVDDNYDANAGLSRLLLASGFNVVGRAYDGLSGLTVVKSEKPDVAILDIAMPALDGFGLARRIRSEMEEPPRLVALTGFGKESDRSEALNAGFDAYFLKPADWTALKAVLDSYAPN